VAELAGAAGIPLMELHAGHEMTFGAVRLRVLAPSRDTPMSLAADEANDRSLVIRARTPAATILFTGDIEAEAQASIVRGDDVRADILKVPHHGSRTTTAEFLRAVGPRLALVSAGSDNTFGHPHPTVTTTLAALGATVARTDLDGDVVIVGPAADLRTVTSRRRAPHTHSGPAPERRRGSRSGLVRVTIISMREGVEEERVVRRPRWPSRVRRPRDSGRTRPGAAERRCSAPCTRSAPGDVGGRT
jgi:competence protein ComEC